MTSGIEYVVFTVRVKDPFVYGNIRENASHLWVRDRLTYMKPLGEIKSPETDEDLVYCPRSNGEETEQNNARELLYQNIYNVNFTDEVDRNIKATAATVNGT